MKERYISSEYELPLVQAETLEPAPQDFIGSLWKRLVQRGWELCHGGVKKRTINPAVVNPDVFITTDTGPTIEFAPTPGTSLHEIERRRKEIMDEILGSLTGTPYTLLGSGVHPKIAANVDDYLRLRTPRKAYDYAIKQRGWHHHSIVSIAATQEVIDIPVSSAMDVLRCCHRLTPYMTYLFRNDFDDRGDYGGALSVRPICWRNHIPHDVPDRFANDRQRIWMPEKEITSWSEYLGIIWKNSPMFFIGTKHDGPVFLPEHPTFATYLAGGPQTAIRIQDSTKCTITPNMEHVEGTDWHYMGSARLRWKLDRNNMSIDGLTTAMHDPDTSVFDTYISQGIARLMIENRSSAAAPPGEEIASLAFMVGLLENLEELKEFLFQKPYHYYTALVRHSEYDPYTLDVLTALERLLSIAHIGLHNRNRGEGKYLQPIRDRLNTRLSPSEITRIRTEHSMSLQYRYDHLLYRK